MYSLIIALAANNASTWITMGMLILAVVAFYFIGIRPQKKQDKMIQDMRNALQVGDEITTIGGIIGRVISIREETCMIETGRDRTKIRILKSAIKSVDVPVEATKIASTTPEKKDESLTATNSAPEVKPASKKNKKKKESSDDGEAADRTDKSDFQ